MHSIGLMSGTSMDGIDVALIETDGETVTSFGPAFTVPYDPDFAESLRAVLGEECGEAAINEVEQQLTLRHADAVEALMQRASLKPGDVDVIGFHGHTIAHRPADLYTRQIGDGKLLAETVGAPVVYDFRTQDVAAGGQGAPLVPVFHRALAAGLGMPVAILNIGGVANLTYVRSMEGAPVAFDTGPGNALLDDWARRRTGQRADHDGALAVAGCADDTVLKQLLDHTFFRVRPPKSLDRDNFGAAATAIAHMTAEDGAATLAAFTAAAVAEAAQWLPEPPRRWLVCGGGRHNPAIMKELGDRLGPVPVEPVEAVGWNGDALEAQAFAFLAVRHLQGLPQTFPTTTGCPTPMTGGRLAKG